MRHVRVLFAVPVIALLVAGCGDDDGITSEPQGTPRVVDITMVDNAFEPSELQAFHGETVTFRFKNTGTVRHEAVIGDAASQERHHEEMSAATASGGHGGDSVGGMEHGDGSSESDEEEVTVEPGKTGDLTYTFEENGTVIIGCHETGHWETGMKVTVTTA